MKLPIPSFRTQIIILFLFLLINSALFFRNYFLGSFRDYSTSVEILGVEEKINRLYKDYQPKLSEEETRQFKSDIEEILSTEWQRNLARDLFEKETELYSKFIFVFLTISILILFFISFNLITRPLHRLQSATEDLTKGNWNIEVKESKFSPLNDLITSFNEMIKELEHNRNKLIQAEKEMVWREMARVMAHEIKNPLTPVRLSLERLEQKYQSGAKDFKNVFKNVVSVIHEEIDNLQSLATEFSQFARLPKAVIAAYNLNGQIEELVKPYEGQAEFHLDLAQNLPPFYGDRTQMKQVLVNLIQNAIQSSNNGCQIEVTTTNDNLTTVVSIEDNGSGIDHNDLERIFDPYFSRREKGTGLGLAIVKRIIEQHNGNIVVKSEPEKGTKITISF